MRMICGIVKSTQLQWLPVLPNRASPDLRRKEKLIKKIKKTKDRKSLLLAEILDDTPTLRLRSRKPPWKMSRALIEFGFEISKCWRDHRTQSKIPNNNLIPPPIKELWEWNRLCTGHGCSADLMHKWWLQGSPTCDCGNYALTVKHIIEEYRLRTFNRGIEEIHAITTESIKWKGELDVHLWKLHQDRRGAIIKH